MKDDTNTFEIEEFKLLRQEIMYYNEAAFRTELYVIFACGIVWGWIFSSHSKLESFENVITASSIPAILFLAGFIRYSALKFRVQRLAFYIFCIEHKHFKETEKTSGWEHFVGETRGNNIIGRIDQEGNGVSWKRQSHLFRTEKYRWAYFTRSANLTWFSGLILNIAAFLYMITITQQT